MEQSTEIKDKIQRVRFNELFKQNSNGSLSAIRPVSINGYIFGPKFNIRRGVKFGGADLFQYLMYDLAIEEENGIAIIRGVFK